MSECIINNTNKMYLARPFRSFIQPVWPRPSTWLRISFSSRVNSIILIGDGNRSTLWKEDQITYFACGSLDSGTNSSLKLYNSTRGKSTTEIDSKITVSVLSLCRPVGTWPRYHRHI